MPNVKWNQLTTKEVVQTHKELKNGIQTSNKQAGQRKEVHGVYLLS